MIKTQMERGCREAESIPWCYKRSYHLQMLWKLGIHTTIEAETRKCYFNSITNSCYSLWPSPALSWARLSLWEQFSTVCLCDSSRHSLYFLSFPVGFQIQIILFPIWIIIAWMYFIWETSRNKFLSFYCLNKLF